LGDDHRTRRAVTLLWNVTGCLLAIFMVAALVFALTVGASYTPWLSGGAGVLGLACFAIRRLRRIIAGRAGMARHRR
jgi:hypothetical protein